jgi:hypothetical protein
MPRGSDTPNFPSSLLGAAAVARTSKRRRRAGKAADISAVIEIRRCAVAIDGRGVAG